MTGLRQNQTAFITEKLWNANISFFATLSVPPPHHAEIDSPRTLDNPRSGLTCPPKWQEGALVNVRELLGFTPWYFSALPASTGSPTPFEGMWANISTDTTNGFAAQWGLRTAERRAACYNYSGTWHDHECNWNGPVGLATSSCVADLA